MVTCAILITSPAAAQTPHWPDPVANDVVPYETAGLTHGPLLGGVTATSAKVWIRTNREESFSLVYDTRIPLTSSSPRVDGRTLGERDNTGVVTLPGLKPHTRYYYGVRLAPGLADTRIDLADAWPSFRTMRNEQSCPDPRYNPSGKFNVRFAVGHCLSQESRKSGGQYASTPALATMQRCHGDEIDFVVLNGDVIYEEQRDGTLEGVRKNYQQYFSRGRSFSKLLRYVPALFTFDDHDIGWDVHGCGEVGLGAGPHLIRDVGLRGYEEYLGWANFRGKQSGQIRFGTANLVAGSDVLEDPQANFSTLRPPTVSTIHLGNYTRDAKSLRRKAPPKNAGVYGLREVLDDHRLRITPAAKATERISYSVGTHHYYDWQVGNCHFFALDTRGERSRRNAKDRRDPSLFLLGEAQRKWLLHGVAATSAEFIFLISPDPWMIYHTAAHVSDAADADKDDKGDGFPSFVHERELLLEHLDQLEKPVLIFTGDVHASASVRITDNVWEMMCGPLGSTGHPLGTLGNPPRGGNWNSQGRDVEVRWVAGFPNNLPYQRIRNTYYGVVQVNNVLRVASPEGPGYQWCVYDQPQVIVRWHDGYTGRLVYAESISTMDATKQRGR